MAPAVTLHPCCHPTRSGRIRHLFPALPAVVALLGTAFPEGAWAVASLPNGFQDTPVVTGLDQPSGMTFLPDGRVVFVEQVTARVRVVVDGAIAAVDPALTVAGVNTNGNERGLLGIAVDPQWPADPYVYLYYDHQASGKIFISRFTGSGDLDGTGNGSITFDPASRHDVLTDIPDAAFNHNGGTLRFGPDAMLYASLGDDASACAAQDTITLRGKILRLDVSALPPGPDGPPAKSVLAAPGNPFAGPNENTQLIYAHGLRNPFRFHVDPENGDLFISDVGQDQFEEISWATAGGRNFGWPFLEGPDPTGVGCSGIVPVPYTGPIAWYDRTGFAASIVSGGVYRNACDTCSARLPDSYRGDYFYSDYYQGFLRRIRFDGTTWVPAPIANGQPNPTDWGVGLTTVVDYLVGPDGALWYLQQFDATYDPGTGSIRRITGTNSPVAIGDTSVGPVLLALEPPFPNPGYASVEMALRLARSARVTVTVRDLAGRTVRVLLDRETFQAGRHPVSWDGRDDRGREAPAGVYLIEAHCGEDRASVRFSRLP
jgi:glucose/arabinose dehydrogenase